MANRSPTPTRLRQGRRPVARNAALGWSGLVFVAVTVFLAIGAVNSQNNLLFWIFGIAVSGVLVSGLISGSGLMGIRLHAHEIGYAESDSLTRVTYTVTNLNRRLPVFGLVIKEKALANQNATGAFVHHVRAGSSVRVSLDWTPEHRGVFELDRLTAESRFPFGLLTKSLVFSLKRQALVRPASLALDIASLNTDCRSDSGRFSRRVKRGATDAFFGLREYAHGDPRRTVAWKSSARRSQLLVVEHAEPRSSSTWIWIPASVLSSDHLMAERAVAIVSALAQSHTGPVGVWIPSAGVRIDPQTGPEASRRIRDALAMVDVSQLSQSESAPSIAPGDEMLVIGAVPSFADTIGKSIDPAVPRTWLASGSVLPPSLAGTSEVVT